MILTALAALPLGYTAALGRWARFRAEAARHAARERVCRAREAAFLGSARTEEAGQVSTRFLAIPTAPYNPNLGHAEYAAYWRSLAKREGAQVAHHRRMRQLYASRW
jgi:hypothetical protein